MRGDELATRVVEHFWTAFNGVEVHLEKSYDHYRNRDVVDVYIRVWTPELVDYLTELEADTVIRHVTGAGEILRQYRRMECYFYKDDERTIQTKFGRGGPGVHALLPFAPTKRCVGYVRGRVVLYESVDLDATAEGVEATRKVAFLTNLDRTPEGELGFLSLDRPPAFDSVAFRRAIPSGLRLADVLWGDD